MNFVRNAATLLLSNFVALPIAFVSGIVITRYLSTDDRGLYSVAFTVVSLGTLIFQLGWPGATIYRLRRVGSPPAHVAGAGAIAILWQYLAFQLWCRSF